MNTLSLFNGIGTGIQALKNLGVSLGATYVSEIDKFANKTNIKNHPESIQLGDVTKWREWDIDWESIDLVTAGYPCQSWSVAGQQMGDKDPRGALFWTTLDVIANVLKHNPSARFLMENVRMKREFEEYITHHTEQALGHVEKTLINSALVTAQNRQRYYWTNFKVSQPEDRGILLKDILEDEPLPKPENLDDLLAKGVVEADQDLTGESQSRGRAIRNFKDGREKGNSLTANAYKGMQTNGMTNILVHRPCEVIKEDISKDHVANVTDIRGHKSIERVYNPNGKAPTLTTMGGGHREPKVLCFIDENGNINERVKGYSIDERGIRPNQGDKKKSGISELGRVLFKESKAGTITTSHSPKMVTSIKTCYYRKLTPLECERLQGYPDQYTDGVSNTQRYKQIGNGWTLPVIEHIFKCMLEVD